MPRRRYAGYIVLWDGVPCQYAHGQLWRGCIVSPGQDMTVVSQGCSVIPSLNDARNAILATRAATGSRSDFFLARVYADA